MARIRQRMHRVYLISNNGIRTSVFVKASDRAQAERRALRRNPGWKIDHSSLYPRI